MKKNYKSGDIQQEATYCMYPPRSLVEIKLPLILQLVRFPESLRTITHLSVPTMAHQVLSKLFIFQSQVLIRLVSHKEKGQDDTQCSAGGSAVRRKGDGRRLGNRGDGYMDMVTATTGSYHSRNDKGILFA